MIQALQQGNNDGARIYASNAIRKKSESLNLLRLASRIDAVASRVETATTMRQVTSNMTSVVKGMDKAMETMNLERVRRVSPPLFTDESNDDNPPLADLTRDGQIRGAVLGPRRPDVLHGGRDELHDGRVDAAGPGGLADAADGRGGEHRAAARPRGQAGPR